MVVWLIVGLWIGSLGLLVALRLKATERPPRTARLRPLDGRARMRNPRAGVDPHQRA